MCILLVEDSGSFCWFLYLGRVGIQHVQRPASAGAACQGFYSRKQKVTAQVPCALSQSNLESFTRSGAYAQKPHHHRPCGKRRALQSPQSSNLFPPLLSFLSRNSTRSRIWIGSITSPGILGSPPSSRQQLGAFGLPRPVGPPRRLRCLAYSTPPRTISWGYLNLGRRGTPSEDPWHFSDLMRPSVLLRTWGLRTPPLSCTPSADQCFSCPAPSHTHTPDSAGETAQFPVQLRGLQSL